MSKVKKKKPNDFMKRLNNFSNKMFEKSTGLVAPNTSDYEDEPYSYNSLAPSSVYVQQSFGTQYVKQSVSFTFQFVHLIRVQFSCYYFDPRRRHSAECDDLKA